MAIYELDGQAPELPADGRYWIADSAAVIGRVRLKPTPASGSARCCAATTSGSRSASARRSRTTPRLHTDPGFPIVIGDNCVIGHNVDPARLHDRRQQPDRHGRDPAQRRQDRPELLVGAGALVTEGKEFPDNSLIVGAPARAIRTLDDKAAHEIARGADIYVRRWQRYKSGLRRIDG